MKAVEQYFHVVLFIMLYKVVLTFEYVTILMKAILWYFHRQEFILVFSQKRISKKISNVLFGHTRNNVSENYMQHLINFAE